MGKNVGSHVGAVGEFEGSNVGAVGFEEGLGEGLGVGLEVGFFVGRKVGIGEGLIDRSEKKTIREVFKTIKYSYFCFLDALFK